MRHWYCLQGQQVWRLDFHFNKFEEMSFVLNYSLPRIFLCAKSSDFVSLHAISVFKYGEILFQVLLLYWFSVQCSVQFWLYKSHPGFTFFVIVEKWMEMCSHTPSSSSIISRPMAANVVHLQLLLALAAHRLCALNLHTTNSKSMPYSIKNTHKTKQKIIS